MSTFYLLPSRPVLGEQFARYLARLFPGLDWGGADWRVLGDLLGSLAARRPDVFVVYGEELPPAADATAALTHAFGAGDGDVVIEIRPGRDAADLTTHTWQIPIQPS